MRNPSCGDDAHCTSGLRNNYFVGKQLAPDAFRIEQRYLVERRRLLNRAIHGWGLVYGYAIKVLPDPTQGEGRRNRLEIGPGLALDVAGRELLQTHPVHLGFDDLLPIGKIDSEDAGKTCWLLSVHYAEQGRDRVTLNDPCSCRREEWEHVCETVRYSLKPVPCKDCCGEPHCELDCECHGHPCSADEDTARSTSGAADERCRPMPNPARRGSHPCLCEHLTGLEPGAEACLSEIDERGLSVRVDLHHGVPLACVRLHLDDCRSWTFDTWIDGCGPRRLVKRNDLLFDLIRGCDLTRIAWISWESYHRNTIDLADFKALFGEVQQNGGYLTEFKIKFSRYVRTKTLTPDCFAMTAMFHEREGGWREPLRVPIIDVAFDDPAPDGLTKTATLVVKARWVNDALRGDETRFDVYRAHIEIEVRGDYILDCNGQAVDANAIGLSAAPTGNGSPGGTFLSTFQVEPPTYALRTLPESTAADAQGA